jgi:hypothetical protein
MRSAGEGTDGPERRGQGLVEIDLLELKTGADELASGVPQDLSRMGACDEPGSRARLHRGGLAP